jgi:hypothetical protein
MPAFRDRVAVVLVVLALLLVAITVVGVVSGVAVGANMGLTEGVLAIAESLGVLGLALGVAWLLRRGASSAGARGQSGARTT